MFCQKYWSPSRSDRSKTSHFHAFVWRVRKLLIFMLSCDVCVQIAPLWEARLTVGTFELVILYVLDRCVCARCLWCWMFLDNVRIWIEHLHALTICAFLYYYYYCCLPWYSSESAMNYPKKRSKTFVEAYARCITENITKRWLRQTLVVERGIAVSYKYNPLASVPVPEICVPVLCSRAQKVAVIVIKRKCRLIPDLPAPVAQLFVPGGSVDIMTNSTYTLSM